MNNMALIRWLLPLGKEGKKRKMLIDIKPIIEDITKVGLKKREESKRKKCDRYRENDIVCFKCGKKGHTSKYCNFQRKINKLDISGKLKDKLMSILEQADTDEIDNEIHQIDNCDITSSSTYISSDNGKVKLCNCNNPDNCYCKRKLKISVLTEQEDIIMDLIDKLPDLQSKKDYLSKLKESLTQTDRFWNRFERL